MKLYVQAADRVRLSHLEPPFPSRRSEESKYAGRPRMKVSRQLVIVSLVSCLKKKPT